jgi:hypothetical protein
MWPPNGREPHCSAVCDGTINEVMPHVNRGRPHNRYPREVLKWALEPRTGEETERCDFAQPPNQCAVPLWSSSDMLAADSRILGRRRSGEEWAYLRFCWFCPLWQSL